MLADDTIVAIATPPGEGGIGVVRLSGPDAHAIAERIFRPRRKGPLQSHHVRYGRICNPTNGQTVDEALLTLMRGPHSFTREDVVEISCHGGLLVLQQTIQLALAQGARLAEAGEFTMRAFLNGRIDLSQAEATLDIVQARTATGLALAQEQLRGWLAQEVRRRRMELLDVLAYVTVLVDFPEDEVEPQPIAEPLQQILPALERLLAGAQQGMIYRSGARVVLVGQPNVGKSSLLNALLRTERAIVTPIAGTTRDTLEESANFDGVPVVLVDTAGITDSSDPVERLGIERSRSALEQADLALLVFDSSRPLDEGDRMIAALTVNKPTIIVWNKSDSAPQTPPLFEHSQALANVQTSALHGIGIDELVATVARVLLGGAMPQADDARLVSNPRHRDALRRAVEHVQAALGGVRNHLPTDLAAGDLHAAANALGEITGETVGDDLLNVIFSRFCIGK